MVITAVRVAPLDERRGVSPATPRSCATAHHCRGETGQATPLTWIKASQSLATGACVELAADGDLVLLRDSKHPEIVLSFTRAEMSAFLAGAGCGEFTHLVDQ